MTIVHKLFEVSLHRQTPSWGLILEGDMKAISEVSTPAVSETQTNVYALNTIAIICGLGVVVFMCLATSGLDMSIGFF
jgi:hypothetical protein